MENFFKMSAYILKMIHILCFTLVTKAAQWVRMATSKINRKNGKLATRLKAVS